MGKTKIIIQSIAKNVKQWKFSTTAVHCFSCFENSSHNSIKMNICLCHDQHVFLYTYPTEIRAHVCHEPYKKYSMAAIYIIVKN